MCAIDKAKSTQVTEWMRLQVVLIVTLDAEAFPALEGGTRLVELKNKK